MNNLRKNNENGDNMINKKEYEAIKEFVNNDNRDLLSVLVIDKNNEIVERSTFTNNLLSIIEDSDKKLLAQSPKNWDCIEDVCDNCENDCYNEETEEYYCSANESRVKCAIEEQIAYCDDEISFQAIKDGYY